MECYDVWLFFGGIEGYVGFVGGVGEQVVGVNVECMLCIVVGIVVCVIQVFDVSEFFFDCFVQCQGCCCQMVNELCYCLWQDIVLVGMRIQIGIQGCFVYVFFLSLKLGGVLVKCGDNGILFILYI